MESKENLPTLGYAHLLPKPERWMIIASVALVLGLFLFQPLREPVVGKTLIGWTWEACNSRNGFLHGRLVPFIFPCLLFVAYLRSKHLTLSPSYWGLISLSLGLFLFWAGFRATQPRISLLGAPFVLIGFTHYLAGGKIAKFSIFPAFFLYFAIPIPGLEMLLHGKVNQLLLEMLYQITNCLGLDPIKQGSTLITSSGTQLDLSPGLFEIRPLMLTLMTAAVLSHLVQKNCWKKWCLFLTAFPLLIVYTICKSLIPLLLAETGHDNMARTFFHDWSTFFVFAFTIITILLINRLLNRQKVSRRKNLPA